MNSSEGALGTVQPGNPAFLQKPSMLVSNFPPCNVTFSLLPSCARGPLALQCLSLPAGTQWRALSAEGTEGLQGAVLAGSGGPAALARKPGYSP